MTRPIAFVLQWQRHHKVSQVHIAGCCPYDRGLWRIEAPVVSPNPIIDPIRGTPASVERRRVGDHEKTWKIFFQSEALNNININIYQIIPFIHKMSLKAKISKPAAAGARIVRVGRLSVNRLATSSIWNTRKCNNHEYFETSKKIIGKWNF